MRKQYAVAGIVVAILVAGLIVLVGSRSPGRTAAATTEASAATLPASVPSPTASPSDTDYAAMVKLLSARYTRHPSSTRNAMALADAYLMTEQPLKAEALYGKVLAADPGNQTAEAQLAMALHASGRDDQALRLLTSVLAANPRSQLAHYNLRHPLLLTAARRPRRATSGARPPRSILRRASAARPAASSTSWTTAGNGSHSGSGGN